MREKRRRSGSEAIVVAACVCVVLAVVSCGSPAETTGRIRLVAPITSWTWPMYIAMEAGYYERYGLDVELVFANHPASTAMLTGGQADIGLVPLQRAMEMVRRDESFVVVGSPIKRWLFSLIAQPEIQDVADFRGKTLGVAQLGDATYIYGMNLLAEHDLFPSDVGIAVVGAEGRVAALVGGLIDGTMLSPPSYFSLEEAGFNNVANIIDYDSIRAPAVLVVRKSTVENRPLMLRRLLMAHASATKRFYDDQEFAIAAYLHYDRSERQELVRVYERYVRSKALAEVAYILADDIEYVIGAVYDEEVKRAVGAHDYRGDIDNTVVDQLLEEGFFFRTFGPSEEGGWELLRASAFR